MLIVPRASTHLEYTDIPLVLPASRYGQDLTSVYVQRWLDRYLKHQGSVKGLLAKQFRYLEPVGNGSWSPVTLKRDALLSFYYCSAYRLDCSNGVRKTATSLAWAASRDQRVAVERGRRGGRPLAKSKTRSPPGPGEHPFAVADSDSIVNDLVPTWVTAVQQS